MLKSMLIILSVLVFVETMLLPLGLICCKRKWCKDCQDKTKTLFRAGKR